MKKIAITICILLSLPTIAQTTDSLEFSKLRNEVEVLSANNAALKSTLYKQGRQIEADKAAIEDLTQKLADNSKEIQSVAQKLGISIDSVSMNVQKQGQYVKEETESMAGRIHANATIFTVCGLLLLLLTAVVFIFARLKIKSTQQKVEHISDSQRLLKDDNVKLDHQLLGIIESLNSSKEQRTTETNHKLAISIANEVARITQNLIHMDSNVKGVSNLKHRVDAILTSLNSQGYDIPELLGKPFNEGYNMIATMEQDDTLEAGVQIIKRVIKPQIMYNGKMIQAAEVVVAYND